METLFFISFVCMIALGLRGVSLAGEIKDEIGYQGSPLSLHYKIQSQLISKQSHPFELKTEKSKNLYEKCKVNLHIMFLLVVINVLVIFIYG